MTRRRNPLHTRRRNPRHGGLSLRTQRRERRAYMGIYLAIRALDIAGLWESKAGFHP